MRTSQPTAANAGTHGLGAGPAAQRLPVAPRERKPALAALAVLLILGGALVSAYLVINSGKRVSAIRIIEPVAAGQQIPASALQEVQIGNTGIDYVRWSSKNEVTQTYASVGLVEGTLLTSGMTTRAKDGLKGRVIVGLSLKAAQMPAEKLSSGQTVALYAVAGRSESALAKPGILLVSDAIVSKVVFNGGRTGTGTTEVSVAVPPEFAAALSQAASSGGIVAVYVPPGTVLPKATPPVVKPQPKPGG
ncbi:hypothetical protein [Actinocorallia lasiicapitis]